ncbi:UvrD-helicase domain-containing protein [Streptomyces sp. NBC_00444]|uniref:UvrD-helicase domain-containing protein n=1 Tax=Streptomyces sp. NBC_00444 TaxID=2975744 RepID=UPI002E1CC8E4
MPQLALDIGFLSELHTLQKPVKKGVIDAWKKFTALSLTQLLADKGLHVEKLKDAIDPHIRTIRISGFWRGVVLAPESGETFVLLKVLPHDEAIAWGRKQKSSINTATQAVEIRDAGALDALEPSVGRLAVAGNPPLFHAVSDGEMKKLGVDEDTLRRVRTLNSMDQLEMFAPFLPADQCEVLMYLATGWPVQDVWSDIVAHRAAAEPVSETEDFDTAVRRTSSRIALVTASEELQDILEKPFAAWRVYLHPSQRRVAYRPTYWGPAQVSGGPGTGKTVVALHRVKHLLAGLGQGERILLTTYTNVLAASLRSGLRQLVADTRLLDRADVLTTDALANRVVSPPGGSDFKPLQGGEELEYWQRVIDELQLPWTAQFLDQEYRHVVMAQALSSLDEYRDARRKGRGSQLHPNHRPLVWQAVERFIDLLTADKRCTYLQRAALAADVLTATGPLYRHIVVDEAQDLHPVQWRLLRAAVGEGADDLFIAGDPNQRIYDSKVSLKALGIGVAGRSTTLRKNYRSTQEILRWSAALLLDQTVEGIAESEDDEALLHCRSALHGTIPETYPAADPEEESQALASRVRDWLNAGVRPEEIGVATRFTKTAKTVKSRLESQGIAVRTLRQDAPSDAHAVSVGTMHSFKGLEFRCVAVVGVRDGAIPYQKALTPPEIDRRQFETDLMAERCLLFVACTRAREQLYVSWSGRPSSFLSSLAETRGTAS